MYAVGGETDLTEVILDHLTGYELAKTFDPAAIEAKWYAHWEQGGLFRPERPDAQPFTIVNPSQFTNDLGVTRTFNIGGTQNLQFRWEVFNVINHVNYNAPVTSLNSGTFGQILTAGDPRIMQFAVKFSY